MPAIAGAALWSPLSSRMNTSNRRRGAAAMVAPLTANGLFRKSKTGSALSGVAFGRRPGRLDQYRQALRHRHRIEGAHSRAAVVTGREPRSEEPTSELQSLMRISYAAFRLKK